MNVENNSIKTRLPTNDKLEKTENKLKEQLIKEFENKLNKGLELLGNSRNLENNHKAYDCFFDARKIYLYLKEKEKN